METRIMTAIIASSPRLLSVLGATLLLLSTAVRAQAQSATTPDRGFQPSGSYALGDLEIINTVNWDLMLRIPTVSLPRGRGENEGASINLIYNSKLYDTRAEEAVDQDGEPFTRYRLYPGGPGGWRYGLQYQLELFDATSQYINPPECPDPLSVYAYRLKMIFPDGSAHEFRPQGYTEYLNLGLYNISPGGVLTTCSGTNYITTIVNTTLTYYSTDGSYLRLDIAPDSDPHNWQNNPWVLSFPNGGRVTGGNASQRIYDKNNNYVEFQNITFNGDPATKIVDQLGRSIIVEYDNSSRDFVYAWGVNNVELKWTVKWKTVRVRKNYDGRGGTSDPQQLDVNLRMVEEIDLPAQAGLLDYKFAYNSVISNPCPPPCPETSYGWGEVNSFTLPSGAQAAYQYDLDGVNNLLYGEYAVNNRPKRKELNYLREYDGSSTPTTEIWLYESTAEGSRITAPDGGVVIEKSNLLQSGVWDSGLVYNSQATDGTITERIWRPNTPQGVRDGYGNVVDMNPFLKTEFKSVRDAANTLVKTAIKDFNYDKNGNATRIAEYDWVDYASVPRDGDNKPTGIPASATLKRVTVNSYYNSTPDASDTATNDPDAYHKPTSKQVRQAVESVEVRSNNDPAQVLSREEFFYDNPATTGNVTQRKTWDSAKGGITRPLSASNSISISHQYDGYGNPTLTTDARNIQSQSVYGVINGFSDLYVTETKTAYGTAEQRTARQEYDFYSGQVTRATDVENNVAAATTYDVFGRPTLVVSAEGKLAEETRIATAYSDVLRREIVRSDLNAAGDGKLVTIRHYDQLGRIRLVRQLEDAATQNPEDEAIGIKAQTRYMNSSPNSYRFISNPYRAATSAGAGVEPTMGWTREKFDSGARLIEVQVFTGAGLPAPFGTNTNTTGVAMTSYNGIYTTATDQAGKMRRSKVDACGRVIRIDEPDATNNLGTVELPSQPTSYTYDALNNLRQVNQGGQTRTFGYSSLSRLTSVTNPESGTAPGNGTITYKYDGNGNLEEKTDERNVVSLCLYDSLNRITSCTYSDSTPAVSYIYDDPQVQYSKGRLTKVNTTLSPTNIWSYSYNEYDALGRIKRSKQRTDGTDYPMAYEYDRAGNMISQTYPSNKVITTSYDSVGRISNISAPGKTYANSFSYTPHGAVAAMSLSNGVMREQRSYNARLQVSQIELRKITTSELILGLDYGYGTTNNNGDLLTQTIRIGTGTTISQSYTYDELDRLKTATETGAWAQTYAYDRYGNRAVTAGFVPNITLTPQTLSAFSTASNRLTASTYDQAGNQTIDAAASTFGYDANNKQVSSNVGGVVSSYHYDGEGRRVKKVVGASTTVYVYNVIGQLIAEYTSGAPQGSGTSYLMSDPLGSTRVVTASDGTVKGRHDYLPFGEEIAANIGARSTISQYGQNDGISQKFTSKERDNESGLDYFGVRYYSGPQGRFTSIDPALESGKAELPQSWNRYSYVLNNPFAFIDPNGEVWIELPGGHIFWDWRDLTQADVDVLYRGGKIVPVGTIVIVLKAGTTGQYTKYIGRRVRLGEAGHLEPYGVPEPETVAQIDFQHGLGQQFFEAYVKFALGEVVGNLTGAKLVDYLSRLYKVAKAGGASKRALKVIQEACFVEGTKVITSEGEKDIQELAVGDKVLASDPVCGYRAYQRVSRVFVRTAGAVLDLEVGGLVISATPEHPFWVEGEGWVAAGNLVRGSPLLTKDGKVVRVESIKRREGEFTVYNIEVKRLHTYFVSPLGLLVHNDCDTPNFPSLKDHAKRHGGGLDADAYYNQAVAHTQTGRRFLVRHEGQNKFVYLTRTGENSFIFTSTGTNGRTIFTHLEVDSRYLRNKGITLPKGF